MKTYGRLLQFLRGFRKWIVLSVMLGWATVTSWVALISTSAYLISYAALQPSVAALQVAIVGVRLFGISRGVFRYLERLVSHSVTFRLLAKIRVWLYSRIEPLAPAGLQDQRSGDLLSGMINDVETLQDFYTRVVAPPVVAILSSLGVAWFLGRWSASFALILLAFQIFTGLIVPVITRWMGKKTGRDVIYSKTAVSAIAVEIVRGHADILAFQQERAWMDQITTEIVRQQEAEEKFNKIEACHSGLIALGVNLTSVFLLWNAIPMVGSGELDGRLLAVIVLGALASFEAILPLPQAFLHLEESLQAGNRLFQFEGQQPEVDDGLGDEILEPFAQLEIKNISFAYSHEHNPVLRDFNLNLQSGKKVAIVGASGVGKSTVLNLLLRFWDYKIGKILFNWVDLREYNPVEWRKLISYVPQNTFIFNTSIRENIQIGKPGATMDEIIVAAGKANLREFISSLPEGFDTIAGEQGALLSGGERQRLGIARAVVKQAPIMLLDEPTANLDRINEQFVLESILKAAENRSLIWISHRLTGLNLVDEILVMDDGIVVESGTHCTLLEQNGYYARMLAQERDLL
jgi:ATP-binding cassette subfamily C protein CydC